MHLYIDAGATSTDYDFTDSVGHTWSSDTSYTGESLTSLKMPTCSDNLMPVSVRLECGVH